MLTLYTLSLFTFWGVCIRVRGTKQEEAQVQVSISLALRAVRTLNAEGRFSLGDDGITAMFHSCADTRDSCHYVAAVTL